MCTETYVNESLPALVMNIEESHAAIRDYTIAILMGRRSVTQTALTHASDKFYTNLRENGRKGRRQAAFGLRRVGHTMHSIPNNDQSKFVCG